MSLLLTGWLCVSAAHVAAQMRKPKVPAGRDPGGIAVAVLGTGIDYTDTRIAGRLARDGEGELIGWDMVDGDARPFGPVDEADGAASTQSLATMTTYRLIPLRFTPDRPQTAAQAIEFAANTPARIVLVPSSADSPATWAAVRYAAGRRADMLFVVVRTREVSAPLHSDLPDDVLRLSTEEAAADLILAAGNNSTSTGHRSTSTLTEFMKALPSCASLAPRLAARPEFKFRLLAALLDQQASLRDGNAHRSTSCAINLPAR